MTAVPPPPGVPRARPARGVPVQAGERTAAAPDGPTACGPSGVRRVMRVVPPNARRHRTARSAVRG